MMNNIDMSNNSPRNHLIRIYGMVYILTVHVHMCVCVYMFRTIPLVPCVYTYIHA